MKRKETGYIILSVCGLFLALIIYSLKFIYLIEYQAKTPNVIDSPLSYLGEPVIIIAILIIICIAILGLYLAIRKE
jgi:hypothetical protein